MSWLKQLWLLALILIGAGAGLAYDMDRPFAGGYQSYSANYSVIARNYLRYGYGGTKLGWVINADRVSPEQFIYYTRHPPLFGVILSLGVRVLGDNARAARLVCIAFALGSVALIFFLGRELWDTGAGLLAALLSVLAPIFFAYGAHVDHIGSPLVFFLHAMFLAYVLWQQGSAVCTSPRSAYFSLLPV